MDDLMNSAEDEAFQQQLLSEYRFISPDLSYHSGQLLYPIIITYPIYAIIMYIVTICEL